MTTTTDATAKLAWGRGWLDASLRNHASDLDVEGQLMTTATLATHLVRTVFDSDRLIAAALLHAWWGPAGDNLHFALAAINDADYDLDQRAEHDGLCRHADAGQCDTCDDILTDILTDALNGLRALLGDTVCADLTAAVTA